MDDGIVCVNKDISHYFTFAVAGGVRYTLQRVEEGGKGGEGGEEVALERVALGHQQLQQWNTDLDTEKLFITAQTFNSLHH